MIQTAIQQGHKDEYHQNFYKINKDFASDELLCKLFNETICKFVAIVLAT